MKESMANARPVSRVAAFAGGVVAALAAVTLVAVVGIGNATAAPQVARGDGAGTAVVQATAAGAGQCLQSMCTGFQDADADGVCDNYAARQSAQQSAVGTDQLATQQTAQQAAQLGTGVGAVASVSCRNDADGDGICDICGSATPANCSGRHQQNGNGYGPGDGTGNGADGAPADGTGYGAAAGAGYGNGAHCGTGADHCAHRYGC